MSWLYETEKMSSTIVKRLTFYRWAPQDHFHLSKEYILCIWLSVSDSIWNEMKLYSVYHETLQLLITLRGLKMWFCQRCHDCNVDDDGDTHTAQCHWKQGHHSPAMETPLQYCTVPWLQIHCPSAYLLQRYKGDLLLTLLGFFWGKIVLGGYISHSSEQNGFSISGIMESHKKDFLFCCKLNFEIITPRGMTAYLNNLFGFSLFSPS